MKYNRPRSDIPIVDKALEMIGGMDGGYSSSGIAVGYYGEQLCKDCKRYLEAEFRIRFSVDYKKDIKSKKKLK